MKSPWISLFLFGGLLLKCAAAEVTIYSADADVRRLTQVTMVNFGGYGMTGSRSAGEILLRRILKREDAFKCLIEVYNSGTPAAKVYALAYFHHSAPELFEICWKDNVWKYNPVVKSAAGCFIMEGSFFEQMIRVRQGEYDEFIELALKRATPSFSKAP